MRLGSTALATGRVERKLAAILAADVAGYSRLMGTDEEGTLPRLKALRRELADPKIKEHYPCRRRGECRPRRGRRCRRALPPQRRGRGGEPAGLPRRGSWSAPSLRSGSRSEVRPQPPWGSVRPSPASYALRTR